MEKIKVGNCPSLGDTRIELTEIPTSYKRLLEFAITNNCLLKDNWSEFILIKWPGSSRTKMITPGGLCYAYCDAATTVLANQKVRVTIGRKNRVQKVFEGIVMLPEKGKYGNQPTRLKLTVTGLYEQGEFLTSKKGFELEIKPTKVVTIEILSEDEI